MSPDDYDELLHSSHSHTSFDIICRKRSFCRRHTRRYCLSSVWTKLQWPFYQLHRQYSDGDSPNGTSNAGWVLKIAIFYQYLALSRKLYKIDASHSNNGIRIGTYIRPTLRYKFEWPWVTISDLANFQGHGASRGLSTPAELVLSIARQLLIFESYC